MTLRIIKPPKPGKMFVTLASTGYLFFSSRAVAELNLSEHKGVLLAHDERGANNVRKYILPYASRSVRRPT